VFVCVCVWLQAEELSHLAIRSFYQVKRCRASCGLRACLTARVQPGGSAGGAGVSCAVFSFLSSFFFLRSSATNRALLPRFSVGPGRTRPGRLGAGCAVRGGEGPSGPKKQCSFQTDRIVLPLHHFFAAGASRQDGSMGFSIRALGKLPVSFSSIDDLFGPSSAITLVGCIHRFRVRSFHGE
jgi:hypothetical protein